jgi:hypothetical protein
MPLGPCDVLQEPLPLLAQPADAAAAPAREMICPLKGLPSITRNVFLAINVQNPCQREDWRISWVFSAYGVVELATTLSGLRQTDCPGVPIGSVKPTSRAALDID